jgi:hypothetical protein
MTPVPEPTAPVALVRVVGVIIGLIGLALLVFAAGLVSDQTQSQGHLDTGTAVFVAVLVPLVWFCLNAGTRFVLNRPSPDDSILSWSGWRILAIYLAAVTLWLIILGILLNVGAGFLALAFGGGAAKFCWDRSAALRAVRLRDAAL